MKSVNTCKNKVSKSEPTIVWDEINPVKASLCETGVIILMIPTLYNIKLKRYFKDIDGGLERFMDDHAMFLMNAIKAFNALHFDRNEITELINDMTDAWEISSEEISALIPLSITAYQTSGINVTLVETEGQEGTEYRSQNKLEVCFEEAFCGKLANSLFTKKIGNALNFMYYFADFLCVIGSCSPKMFTYFRGMME